MKLSEKLKILKAQFNSYFVSDQVKMFVLFLDDFFPSEKIFGLFGFTFFNEIQNSSSQRGPKRLFWMSVTNFVVLTISLTLNFAFVAGKSEKFVEFIETYGWLSGYCMILMKIYFVCSWKRKAFAKIIVRLDQHFPHSSRLQLNFKVNKHHRLLKKFYWISLVLYGCSWFHYIYLPLLMLLFGNKFEILHPVYIPIESLQPLLYPIIFILECWNTGFVFLKLIAMDILFCSLVGVTSMELDVLAQKISQIDPEIDENAEKELIKIIHGYNKLIDIANELEEIFSPILFVNVFAGISMLCVFVFILFTPITFYLMMKYALVVPLLLFHVFSICFYGEQLQISSMRVADEAYNCNWYGKNLKFRKMILLTMMRAQNAQKLTGMKFMDIGLPVYYWCLQTTHSYYSLLSGLYEA